MAQRIALADVRARLAAAVDQVLYRGERLVIERHGRAVAAIVSIDDLASLEASAPRLAHPAGALALVGVWADIEDSDIDDFLTDIAASRRRDTGRRITLKP